MALSQDDFVVIRDVGLEKRVRRGTNEGEDGLVIIERQNEIFGPPAPFPGEFQLHRIQVLRLIREQD